MIITVFRSRLMPGLREEYIALVDRMVELAETMPGYISHKGFFAEDGERVTVVEFEHEEACGHGACTPNTVRRRKRHEKFTIPNTASKYATWYGNPDSNVRNTRQTEDARMHIWSCSAAIDRTAGRLMKRAVQQRRPGA